MGRNGKNLILSKINDNFGFSSETKGWARYDPKKARRSANLEAIQEYGRVIKRNYGYYDPRLRRIDDANSQQRAVELRLPGSWRIM